MVNFTKREDAALARAYVCITQDGIVGINQAGSTFWERVEAEYLRQQPSNNKRTRHSLQNRICLVRKEVKVYVSCVARHLRNMKSGWCEADCYKGGLGDYEAGPPKRSWKHEEVFQIWRGAGIEDMDPETCNENRDDGSQNTASVASASQQMELDEDGNPTEGLTQNGERGRFYERDLPREHRGRDALKRDRELARAESSGISTLNDLIRDDNSFKRAQGERDSSIFREYVYIKQMKSDMEILEVDTDQMPDWKAEFYIKAKNKVLRCHDCGTID